MKKLIKLGSDFTNAKVGDKVTSVTFGKGKIIRIEEDEGYPIVCKFGSYSYSFMIDGKYFDEDEQPTLFKGHHDNLVVFAEVEETEVKTDKDELETLFVDYIEAKSKLEEIKEQIKNIIS